MIRLVRTFWERKINRADTKSVFRFRSPTHDPVVVFFV